MAPHALRPYAIASIEPLARTSPEERRRAAGEAGCNVSLLDPARIDLDLRSDSASSSRTTGQIAAMTTRRACAEDPVAHAGLVGTIARLTGKRHVVLFAQGRAAEAALADALPLERTTVAANGLFPSTRFHLERRGARVVECLRPGALDFDGEEPFRADLDLDRAREALAAARGPGAIWLELACNGVFGQPVSLDGLDQATALARERGARLYLDASRSLENAALLRRRDPGARDLSVRELLARTLRPAHAVSASCLKSFHAEAGGFVATDDAELARALEDASIARGDGLNGPAREVLRLGLELSTTDGFAEDRALQVARFHERLVRAGLPVFRPEAAHAAFLDAGRFLPHLAPADAPARALALALYLQSGIRIDAHYLPDAPESAGRSVVRLAVPARRWFDDQLDWVAEELAALHARRETTPGLERLPAEPGLSGSLRGRYRIKEEP